MQERRNWEAIAAQKRQEQAAHLEAALSTADTHSNENGNSLGPQEVIRKVSSGQLTAKSIVHAYIAQSVMSRPAWPFTPVLILHIDTIFGAGLAILTERYGLRWCTCC